MYVLAFYLKRFKQTINGETILSVYGQSGALLYRDNLTKNTQTDYLPFNGKNVVRIKTRNHEPSGEYTYMHYDHLGTPISASSEAGTMLWHERHKPYGQKRLRDIQNNNNQGYTGHIEDTDLGLTYMQARFYDPTLGRFLSNDPIGTWGHASRGNLVHGFNRYAYANNNPYLYVDPDGMEGKLPDKDNNKEDNDKKESDCDKSVNCTSYSIDGVMGGSTDDSINSVSIIDIVNPAFNVLKVLKVVKFVTKSGSGAVNNATKVKLEKQLAFQEQLGQLSNGGGTVISQPAKQADRIAAQTGRNPANIQKVSSDARVARDGQQVQTHSFRDASTNELIEPKTIIGD